MPALLTKCPKMLSNIAGMLDNIFGLPPRFVSILFQNTHLLLLLTGLLSILVVLLLSILSSLSTLESILLHFTALVTDICPFSLTFPSLLHYFHFLPKHKGGMLDNISVTITTKCSKSSA